MMAGKATQREIQEILSAWADVSKSPPGLSKQRLNEHVLIRAQVQQEVMSSARHGHPSRWLEYFHRQFESPPWPPDAGLLPFFVIVFSVFLHFSPSYPLLNLFSQFLLLLSAYACVFSAFNFCYISCLNFSCSISFPVLMSSVYFTCFLSFHFQGLFPFNLCLSVCIYTHKATDTYININLEAFWVSKLVCSQSQFVILVSFTLLSYFLCCYQSLNTIQ